MCGMSARPRTRNVVPILIDGIRRLEYRGYDSTGLAVVNGGELPEAQRLVSTARVADLAAQADARHLPAITGISHTRWATHGAPTRQRASARVERRGRRRPQRHHREPRGAARAAEGAGLQVLTQTDSEVIAHLVHAHWHAAAAATCCAPCRRRSREFHGAYAIAVISTREPGRIVGARQGSPLVVGIGDDDTSSRPTPRRSVGHARVAYLEDGDVADVRRESLRDLRRAGRASTRDRRSRRAHRRRGRARAVPALHAEGDLRAAARGGRYARSASSAIEPSLFGANADADAARRSTAC